MQTVGLTRGTRKSKLRHSAVQIRTMIPSTDLSWDDVRIFLAVLRAPSLRVAASKLGMTHPTVRRHLATLESQLGLHLFDRRSTGLHPTPEAEELRAAALEAESGMLSFARRAMAVNPGLEGIVRVSAPDIIASDLLASDFVDIQRLWPRIELRVETSYELADLGGRQADLAIRLLAKGGLPKEDLVGTHAATMWIATYGHNEASWLGWDDEAAQSWMAKTRYRDVPIGVRLENVYLQRAAALAGGGLSMLPCFMAPPELPRRTAPIPVADIWVLIHPDLKRNPRVKVIRDALVAALKRHDHKLAGAENPTIS